VSTDTPLAGYRVIDLSSGIAGAYCTKLVADGGAEVVRIEPPEGDPLRRWSASGAKIASDDDGALFQFLCASKTSVVADVRAPDDMEFVRTLIVDADAVVWSPDYLQQDELSPKALRQLAPHAVIVAISPFGLDGPWVGRAATELTLQAWSGGAGYRGSADRPPTSMGGRLGDWAAGMFGAIGMLASRVRSRTSGQGEIVDVSILESLVLTNTNFPVTRMDMNGGIPFRMKRQMNLPDIHATKDGYVGFMPATGQQWLDFAAMVERPDWVNDESLIRVGNRMARRSEMLAHINEWCGARTTGEVVELASLLRIPVAEVGNGETIPHFDHFVERGMYVKNPRSGFVQPNVPYVLSNGAGTRPFAPAPRLGEHSQTYRQKTRKDQSRREQVDPVTGRLPFEGLRVLDFTAFWAGPIVGHTLAMLGADVIHVESTERMDGMRYSSLLSLDDDKWWEWSPLFQGSNTNKRGLTLDINSDAGKNLVRRLVAVSDVVIENYTPRVFENWGLGYDELCKVNPRIIMVRMPAFGISGPWRDRTGYAQTMEQISGLAWVTGHPDGPPETLNAPCDPIGGSHSLIGLLLALDYRERTGKGMLLEAPQMGGAINSAAEQVIEYSAYGALLERQGNQSLQAVPHNFYLAADIDSAGERDRWVAIATESDEQWQRLRSALGDPTWAINPDLETLAGRLAARQEIDHELSRWCAVRESDDIVETLWAADVPVAKVLLAHEQVDVPQLTDRGWFETVEHPVLGTIRQNGYPARFSAGPKVVNRRPAPLLGEHNHEILSELLNLSDDEIRDLERASVIGNRAGGKLKAF
jgi:crotonobetainyl-CoA:carnitine CoA-transferase CaiB-like acyl-CoA transferase